MSFNSLICFFFMIIILYASLRLHFRYHVFAYKHFYLFLFIFLRYFIFKTNAFKCIYPRKLLLQEWWKSFNIQSFLSLSIIISSYKKNAMLCAWVKKEVDSHDWKLNYFIFLKKLCLNRKRIFIWILAKIKKNYPHGKVHRS